MKTLIETIGKIIDQLPADVKIIPGHGPLSTLDDLKNLGVSGVIFGNIHLADVREWYEGRVRDAGLEHVEPLWGDDPPHLLREVVERGFRSIIVSVDLQQGGADLLGREIDEDFAKTPIRKDHRIAWRSTGFAKASSPHRPPPASLSTFLRCS